MTEMIGFCRNVDFCRIASDRHLIHLDAGEQFVCPECHKPLAEKLRPAKSRLGLAMGLGAGAIIAAGCGFVGFRMLDRPLAAAEAGESVARTPAADIAKVQQTAPALRPVKLAASAPPSPNPVHAVEAGASRPLQPQLAIAEVRPEPSGLQTLRLLHINGGIIMNVQLMPKMAAAFLVNAGDTDVTETRDPTHNMTTVAGIRGPLREEIQIETTSDTGSLAALQSGEAEMSASSTRVNADESDGLALMGDMTSEACEHVVALDGIAVVVNPGNRVTQMDLDQVRAIYRGDIKDWSQVGGTPGPITLWARNKESGTFHEFADTVLRRSPMAAATHISRDDKAIAASVVGDAGAVGFISQAYVGQAKMLALAPKGSTPQKPAGLALETEDYPLTRRFYLYTPAQPKNPFVQKFAEFAQSQAGQDVVAKEGFISLNVHRVAAEVPALASDRYRTVLTGTSRLSVNFRFVPGSTDLDPRGLRDVGRLVALVRASHLTGANLVLVGFADAQGTPAFNMTLARRRVDAVAAALRGVGMGPGQAEALGSEMPVADNSTAEGREKNRRVEVYVRTAQR